MTDDDVLDLEGDDGKTYRYARPDAPMEWKPKEEATSEPELFAGYRDGIMFAPASELVASLEAMAREVATIRELVELLVDWAGARDKVPADAPDRDP